MTKTVAIIGGGLAGLLAAGLLKRAAPSTNILVIEAAENVGGLLRSFDYGNDNIFDHGTHYLSETKIEDINVLLEDALPSNERHIMTGYKTDISGIYFNSKLQNNTPFPDLRGSENRSEYLDDFFQNSAFADVEKCEKNSNNMLADEYYTHRFGKRITQDIIAPIVEKIFNHKLSEMSFVGTKFIPLSRVALLDEVFMRDIVQTHNLSKTICYPEQRSLPINKQSTLRAFYPRKPGIQNFIDGLRRILERDGVTVLTQTKLHDIIFNGSEARQILIEKAGAAEKECIDVTAVICASGPMSILKTLKIDLPILKDMDKPATTAIVNFKLSHPLRTNDLYYFYCYDPGFKTFRVTNYRNYCPELRNTDTSPITLEMVFPGTVPSKEEIIEIGFAEIHRMGILEKETKILFQACEILPYGFPSLTVKNMERFNQIRSAIASLKIQNLYLCGALSEPDVYFQSDILSDTYKKVQTLIQSSLL